MLHKGNQSFLLFRRCGQHCLQLSVISSGSKTPLPVIKCPGADCMKGDFKSCYQSDSQTHY